MIEMISMSIPPCAKVQVDNLILNVIESIKKGKNFVLFYLDDMSDIVYEEKYFLYNYYFTEFLINNFYSTISHWI